MSEHFDAITAELRRRKADPPAGSVANGEVYEWCPFHPDGRGKPPHRPSLRLNRNKEVWYCDPCAEGGTFIELAERLGLETDVARNGSIIASYDYHDDQGNIWGQVVRKTGKKFRVRRPDGNGGWIRNWKGVTRTLYRLSRMLAAEPDEWVFVVEGEKDADRLASLDLVATTNPGGAGKWREEYSEALEGRRVAVIPDNDDAGGRHADKVVRSLMGKAADVRIVRLPLQDIGADVSDWLDRGGTREALLAKVEATETFISPTHRDEGAGETKFISAADLASRAPEAVPWLVKPWVVLGGITMVSGKAKLAGKTTWTLHLMRAVLEGGEFLGERATQGPVVYLTEERTSSFVAALRRAHLADHRDLMIRKYRPGGVWMEVVRDAVGEAQRIGARLIVVDTLPVFAGLAGDNENAAGYAREALDPLSGLNDLAVVVNFHDRKSGGDPGDATRGSSAFAGAVDIIADLRRLGGNGQERRREIVAVGRFDDTPDRVIVELSDDGYRLLGDAGAVARKDAKDSIREALALDRHMTEKQLAEELGDRVKKTTLGDTLREMLDTEEVARQGEGKKGSPYCYFLSPSAPSYRARERNHPGSREGEEVPIPGDNGLKPTDGPLVRYGVELGLPIVGRRRWK